MNHYVINCLFYSIFYIFRHLFSKVKNLTNVLTRIIKEENDSEKEFAIGILQNITSSSDKSYKLMTDVPRELHMTLVEVIKDDKTEISVNSKSQSIRIFKNTTTTIENRLTSVDLLDALSKILIEETGLLRLDTLELLNDLSAHDENCILFTEETIDLFRPLVAVMKENLYKNDDITIRSILSILENLSFVEDSRIAISKPSLELVHVLSSIINQDYTDIRKKGLYILSNIYKADEVSLLIKSPPTNVLKVLMDVIMNDPENQLKALEIICNLSASSDSNRSLLLTPHFGLLEELIKLIRIGSSQAKMESFIILGNLLSYEQNIKIISSPKINLIGALGKWKSDSEAMMTSSEDRDEDDIAVPTLFLDRMIQLLQKDSMTNSTIINKSIRSSHISSFLNDQEYLDMRKSLRV